MAGKRLQRPADNEGRRITAHPAAAASSQHMRPKFSLEYLDRTFCLSACITDEVRIIAFRCIGKAPMVGYRVDEVFFVVWIDRAFTLYSH